MNPARGSIRIRSMTFPDVDRLVDLAGRLKQAPHWPRAAYEAVLSEYPRRIALVAEDGQTGPIAGFVIAILIAPEAEIETLAVEPELQRRGIGRQLVGRLKTEVRGHGITKVHLEVRSSNQPALRLYDQLGFVQTMRRIGYYADPEEDAVVMQVDLSVEESS
jgi:[ribosomal protein S18]-alanine N-acetyltransferase